MLNKKAVGEPSTEEKFNEASALAGAATFYVTGIIADLLNANAELGQVVDETSSSIDVVRDAAEAEVERLTMLRDSAISKTLENGVVIENLRRIAGDIA